MIRLFCFPYAGGGPLIFRDWPALLPKEIDLRAVEFPGRGSRLQEAPFRRLESLVQQIADNLSSDVSFAFFGHSMGALVAFELARELRRRNQPGPIHLFVSACPVPKSKPFDRPIHNLPKEEFVKEMRRLNGTPPEVLEHPELMEIFLPVIRADFEVVETYQYQEEPPLECAVSAFGGIEDLQIGRANLEAWKTETCGPFSLSMFQGGHFFLRHKKTDVIKRIVQKLFEKPERSF